MKSYIIKFTRAAALGSILVGSSALAQEQQDDSYVVAKSCIKGALSSYEGDFDVRDGEGLNPLKGARIYRVLKANPQRYVALNVHFSHTEYPEMVRVTSIDFEK